MQLLKLTTAMPLALMAMLHTIPSVHAANETTEAIVNPCPPGVCPKDQVCVVLPVQCVKAPCPPTWECRPRPTPLPTIPDVCATVRCRDGYICEPQPVQCIKAPCPPIPVCVPLPTLVPPVCRPPCPKGQQCEYRPVQCIKPPCPPQPTCVPMSAPPSCGKLQCGKFQECRYYKGEPYCADICVPGRCPPKSVCKLVPVQCIRAPCPPVAQCFPRL